MGWLITLIVVVIAAIVTIWFLNRFYRKATREVALIRTGFGGKQVVLDGGCLVLPFLHQVAEVNMKTARLEIRREGARSLITQDRLRVDLAVEFHIRVHADADGVATAAQAFGGKTFRAVELQELIEGKLSGAVQGVVAQLPMDQLHEQRLDFVAKVRDAVREDLAHDGLDLESVSLTHLDQTPFHALDENNAFNAVGMRRLAEIISQNKKERAAIEADADVSVRQSQLEASKRKLVIEREQEQAELEQQLGIATLKAGHNAEIAERNAGAEQRAEAARIAKERDVHIAELDKQRQLREIELNTQLALELAQRQNHIDLAHKAGDVAQAEAAADRARSAAAAAAESIQTEKDRAIAERARQIAVIRAAEQSEVEAQRNVSAADSVRSQARAAADAQQMRAGAEADAALQRAKTRQAELLAEAEGRRALAEVENGLSPEVIRMRLQQHKLDTLPELVAQMVKPVEKIEGIRINQISGFGTPIDNAARGGDKPLVNQAIDGMLGMALQLPVLQKLGRDLGINLEQGLSGVADDDDENDGDKRGEDDTGNDPTHKT
jgi:uncharacterized membrane protein YqiK